MRFYFKTSHPTVLFEDFQELSKLATIATFKKLNHEKSQQKKTPDSIIMKYIFTSWWFERS